jgi:peptide/nickel transport system substrate-binding protein
LSSSVLGRGPAGLCRALGTAAAVLALAAGACRPAPAPRTLLVGLNRGPLTLDPHYHNDAVTWSFLANFYDGLVRFSADMRLEPALALRWEQVEPALWRFTLRPDARFSSGERVRPEDVTASILRGRDDPRSNIRHHLAGIIRVTAEGAGTVVVETAAPSPTLLNRLAFLMVIPARAATGSELTSIDGTGPYRVVGGEPGKSVDAESWPSWHGLPPVERVRFEFFEDERQLMSAFLAGRVDVARQLPEDQLGELRARPGLGAELQPRLQVQMLSVCPQAATGETARALADPRVRRAMLLALDRGRYVREVYRGNGVVASQYVQPVVAGYDPAVTPLPYDPERARVLLREAGFPGGFSVTLVCSAGQRLPDQVGPIVADLGRVGIVTRVNEVPWTELLQRAREHRSELAVFGWGCSTGDASDFLNAFGHSPAPDRGLGTENYSGYDDPETDALIVAADRELDPERRLSLLQAAQRRLLEALPMLPVNVRFGHVGVSARVDVVTRHDQWLLVEAFRWKDAAP